LQPDSTPHEFSQSEQEDKKVPSAFEMQVQLFPWHIKRPKQLDTVLLPQDV
jgi:hypothetical protein